MVAATRPAFSIVPKLGNDLDLEVIKFYHSPLVSHRAAPVAFVAGVILVVHTLEYNVDTGQCQHIDLWIHWVRLLAHGLGSLRSLGWARCLLLARCAC